VILDGAVIPADRCRQKTVSVRGEVIDLWYSGKAHTHGANIQAVIAPDGFPLWVSQAEPGSVHDLTAARLHALPALYHAAASNAVPSAGRRDRAGGPSAGAPAMAVRDIMNPNGPRFPHLYPSQRREAILPAAGP
jgi:hypothetical protein